jgi:multicomponent Na+:H+ antiporter subunit D
LNAVALPILLPLFTALVTLLMRPSRYRRGVVLGSAALQVALAVWLVVSTQPGPMVLSVGAWTPPFGIVLVADLLSTIMITLAATIALAAIVYGHFELPCRLEHPLRVPLVQLLMVGLNQSFLTGDLFNLFVAFEVMLICSYALLTLEADDWDIKQAFPYLAINAVGSMMFLAAAGLAYGIFGTLNFAEMSVRASSMSDDPRVVALAVMLLGVFGIKAGLFPLYFWLPNSYPILPTPLAALFGGMLTKVGVYVLLRVFGTVLPQDLAGLHTAIAWLGGVTMLLGVIGAVSRNFVRGILSFHILSQIGYMVLAIGLFSPYAIAAAIFYNIHNNLVKSSLFLAGGTISLLNGTDDLKRSANLWRATPVLGVAFLLLGLSLAGLPPLSGFWGKLMIVQEGLRQREFVLVFVALFTSIFTLLSMMKIWNASFWTQNETVPVRLHDRRWTRLAGVVVVMALLTVGVTVFAGPLLELSHQAARQVYERQGYIDAVLSDRPEVTR